MNFKIILHAIYPKTHLSRFNRSFSLTSLVQNNNIPKPEDPVHRIRRILKADVSRPFDKIKTVLSTSSSQNDKNEDARSKENGFIQSHCDVLIIGGGAIGSSTAYWLKKKAREGLNVVVLEKDPTYKKCSTVLSVGGLRQQFSVEENVQMSLFTADFLRNIHKHLRPDCGVHFYPHGYLTLATESGSEVLLRNSQMQNELGAKNDILTASQLQNRFPWINAEGISIGCFGREKEGWFDPWLLLQGLRARALELGSHYISAEVVDFINREQIAIEASGQMMRPSKMPNEVIIRTADGNLKSINFAICVIAAGADSGKVARLAKIGTGTNLLAVPLPVEPRKRYVYCISCQDESSPGLNTPLTVDPSGTYFRRDGLGGDYICGKSPSLDDEPSCDNLEVDYDFFENHVWPDLAYRVPSFEAVKLKSAWAGFYEMNLFDENGIVGAHPYYNNLIFATGFSGHGIQQSPAVGNAVAELIIDGGYKTIDLTRLGFDRLVINQPVMEANII